MKPLRWAPAVQAALKARNAALNDVVMTDVCPYSMGVGVRARWTRRSSKTGFYAPILERNSHIPVSREERFNTLQDNQKQIHLRVYQGENPLVKNNILLGEIKVTVPKAPAQQECVDVRFTYDLNGLLEVEVTVVSTGAKQRLVIEGNPGVLTKEEIDRRFDCARRSSSIHPRDELVNKQLMARAERMYEESLGDLREVISSQLVHFRSGGRTTGETRDCARARRLRILSERPRAESLARYGARPSGMCWASRRRRTSARSSALMPHGCKITSPESDAAGYMKLREAFEAAKHYAAVAAAATICRTKWRQTTELPALIDVAPDTGTASRRASCRPRPSAGLRGAACAALGATSSTSFCESIDSVQAEQTFATLDEQTRLHRRSRVAGSGG